MNNADVASLLGLDVLLVANGGLGSTYDVLTLNKTLCSSRGVRVSAILLNKVCWCDLRRVLVSADRAHLYTLVWREAYSQNCGLCEIMYEYLSRAL